MGLIVAFVLVALVAAACGGDDDDTGSGGGGIDYGSLSGEIAVDGSSTVFPISAAMAEEFARVADTRVNVGLSGTGGGFEKFCRGETQISDASRPIKQDEIDACAESGITDIVELQVAIDALTVVVNEDNDWATCMSVEQLTNAFKTGGARTWSEIDPSWPDEQIIFNYPGADSGTFDYFVEVLEGEEEGATHRSDGTSSEDDNVLVRAVEGNEQGVAYFGFAYYQQAGQNLRAVAIDGGEGCVEPTFENALDGSYQPLSRPLFIYTRESFLEERPEVLGFVNFYFENLDEIVEEVGYITLPDDLRDEQEAKYASFLPQ
ncbi:MAG: PstS family phosphate ABC transporter substrate-binding protein [Dehalococcoidia bacterium]